MKTKLYVPLFSITLLLSAFLLFIVQPMFSKMILPLLGGAPQVWNTAMLFFQLALLLGYAYAHGTTKFLSARSQGLLHVILLIIFFFVLPFGIPAGWAPPTHNNPQLWQIMLMATTIGGPFFALAASAPMLQRWFSKTDHKDADNPYFLYAASNFGSIGALFLYPLIIEPFLTLQNQAQSWTYGYIALGALVLLCALSIWRTQERRTEKASEKAKNPTEKPEVITWRRRLIWLLLAAIPSSLMLGVTTYITTDIASVPLIWIVPLALYVGTFIIVFARKTLIPYDLIMILFACTLIPVIVPDIFPSQTIFNLAPVHLLVFFFAALTCHTELANLKPSAKNLTEFYLIMSLGGALGGFFNAIIAPQFLISAIEYPIVLGLATFARYLSVKPSNAFKKPALIMAIIALFALLTMRFTEISALSTLCIPIIILSMVVLSFTRYSYAIVAFIALIIFQPGQHNFENIIHQDRNFFGVLKVIDDAGDGDNQSPQRFLLHGTTNHGTQSLDPEHALTPLSYYSPASPLSEAFNVLNNRADSPQDIAILGLGVGVTACYQRDERHFDFFEIDSDVIEIAENPKFFTFLRDCGSPYTNILGDGRLTIQNQPDGKYDMIVGDAFSSDNIPIHLLTKEAIALYLQKLKPNGILIFNVSNNYLDIEPVLAMAADHFELMSVAKLSKGGTLNGTNLNYYPAHFVVMTKDQTTIDTLLSHGHWSPSQNRDGVKLWTDNYSNILSVIINKTGAWRMDAYKKDDSEIDKNHLSH